MVGWQAGLSRHGRQSWRFSQDPAWPESSRPQSSDSTSPGRGQPPDSTQAHHQWVWHAEHPPALCHQHHYPLGRERMLVGDIRPWTTLFLVKPTSSLPRQCIGWCPPISVFGWFFIISPLDKGVPRTQPSNPPSCLLPSWPLLPHDIRDQLLTLRFSLPSHIFSPESMLHLQADSTQVPIKCLKLSMATTELLFSC